jgi:hypothetical protein
MGFHSMGSATPREMSGASFLRPFCLTRWHPAGGAARSAISSHRSGECDPAVTLGSEPLRSHEELTPYGCFEVGVTKTFILAAILCFSLGMLASHLLFDDVDDACRPLAANWISDELRSTENSETDHILAAISSAGKLTDTLRQGQTKFVVFCLTKPEDAQAFAERFGGERLPEPQLYLTASLRGTVGQYTLAYCREYNSEKITMLQNVGGLPTRSPNRGGPSSVHT